MWSYFRPWKEGRLDIPGFIREAKNAGAEGVELLDFFYSGQGTSTPKALTSEEVADKQAEAVAVLKETGMPIPIFSIAQNFAKVDPDERRNQLQKIHFGVDQAVLFGAGVVRVFAGD